METRISYAQVGLFVIVLSVAMVAGAYWLIASSGHQRYQDFWTIMHESVAGLSVDSAVNFNGVKVGFVRAIHLNPSNPREVRIRLAVAEGTPVTAGTVATLEPQGLTGLRFVELSTIKAATPSQQLKTEDGVPVIKSQPSLIFRLDTAIRVLTQDMDKISQGVEHIVGEKNRKALSDTLQNLSTLSGVFAKNQKQLDSTLKNVNRVMQHGVTISQQLPSVLTEVKKTAQAVQGMSKQIKSASKRLDQTLQSSQAAAQTFSAQTLPASTRTMEELSQTAEAMRQLLETLKSHPSVILRGQRPALGPGEK